MSLEMVFLVVFLKIIDIIVRKGAKLATHRGQKSDEQVGCHSSRGTLSAIKSYPAQVK